MLATRNVVHAAFWLLEVMLALAGLFLLLSAEFMAMVQLLVYAGAVAVLVLFVIMLTLRRREDAIRPRDWSWPAAGMAALFGGLVLSAVVRYVPSETRDAARGPRSRGLRPVLFTTWMLPFELASLVLLVALSAPSGGRRRGRTDVRRTARLPHPRCRPVLDRAVRRRVAKERRHGAHVARAHVGCREPQPHRVLAVRDTRPR